MCGILGRVCDGHEERGIESEEDKAGDGEDEITVMNASILTCTVRIDSHLKRRRFVQYFNAGGCDYRYIHNYCTNVVSQLKLPMQPIRWALIL